MFIPFTSTLAWFIVEMAPNYKKGAYETGNGAAIALAQRIARINLALRLSEAKLPAETRERLTAAVNAVIFEARQSFGRDLRLVTSGRASFLCMEGLLVPFEPGDGVPQEYEAWLKKRSPRRAVKELIDKLY